MIIIINRLKLKVYHQQEWSINKNLLLSFVQNLHRYFTHTNSPLQHISLSQSYGCFLRKEQPEKNQNISLNIMEKNILLNGSLHWTSTRFVEGKAEAQLLVRDFSCCVVNINWWPSNFFCPFVRLSLWQFHW